jgi:hypothetical protein
MYLRSFAWRTTGGEELVRDLVLQQTLAVLGERRRVERRLIDPHVQNHLNNRS